MVAHKKQIKKPSDCVPHTGWIRINAKELQNSGPVFTAREFGQALLSAMDCVETYWGSNNDFATRKESKDRILWRKVAEKMAAREQ